MEEIIDIDIDNILFVEIETVTGEKELKKGTELYDIFKDKFRLKGDIDDEELPEIYSTTSQNNPEFSKVVAITLGRIIGGELMLESFSDKSESTLLNNFMRKLDAISDVRTRVCGFKIKTLSIPFILNRCISNGLPPHKLFDNSGLKPWEILAIDMFELWKNNLWRIPTLPSICLSVGLDYPKSLMVFGNSTDHYYSGGLSDIVNKCEVTTHIVANLFLKSRLNPTVSIAKSKDRTKNVPLINHIYDGGEFSVEDLEKMIKGAKGSSDEYIFPILEYLVRKRSTQITRKVLDHIKSERKEKA